MDMQAAAGLPELPPKDGFGGLFQNWRFDLLSGFTIFLVALPLSIGISVASGAPPTAGLLAAIVGGLFGGVLGGSFLTINGPAAGLIVIIAGAIHGLSDDPIVGFKRMLACAVIAGLLQVMFGIFRLGIIGAMVPTSVIHGMMAAIGTIIMAKQIHVVLGVKPVATDVIGLIGEIPSSIMNMNEIVAIVGGVCLLMMVLIPKIKNKWVQMLPVPLLVALAGIGFDRWFDFEHAHLLAFHWIHGVIGPELLLNVPDNLRKAIFIPDFTVAFTAESWRWIICLALVGSIESLLTTFAVDKMDPFGRQSDLDRELVSKGVCNIICGLIGGLPIIAEVVRSSANIRAGARTRWANVFHGGLILVFLMTIPQVLHAIPVAALAAILVVIGFRLAHPAQFMHTAAVGRDHFATFVTTYVVTLAADLLVGVCAGIAMELAFALRHGVKLKDLFSFGSIQEGEAGSKRVVVDSPLMFSNYLQLKKTLDGYSNRERLVLDVRKSRLIDHTVLDHLERYRVEAKANGGEFNVEFSVAHRGISKHPLSSRRL